MKKEKRIVRGEFALLFIILFSSLGVDLMIRSGSGISAISSVPYSLSEVCPVFTLGVWTYIFQGILVLSLMVLKKRFVPQYLLSFFVGFAFSIMLDVHEQWIQFLPQSLFFQIVYFGFSYLLICFGIALSNRCGMPIAPTDLFPKELSCIKGVAYSRIKMSFDISCLTATALITFGFFGHIKGLGIGTILAAFTMGKVIGIIGDVLDRHVTFVSGIQERRLVKRRIYILGHTH